MTNKHIVFTGGGSPGHVTPNIALLQKCQQEGWQTSYIGSSNGVEKALIEPLNVPYYAVSSGKLRRYFSWQNFLDPFKIVYGILQSTFLLRKLRPNVVFSKGGFVAFPVVVGAWLNRIPVVAHESDLMPGLANRLGFPFAKRICLTFQGSEKYFKNKAKVVVTGTPIRQELFAGDAKRAFERCAFTEDKPTVLVTGGGLGAQAINQVVRQTLPNLLTQYNVVHLCGEGKTDESYNQPGYKQVDYAHGEMADLLQGADIVVSRAGSNTVYELLALHKPHVFVPLPREVSNGHQIVNAKHFAELGLSTLLLQEDLTPETLMTQIQQTYSHKNEYSQRMAEYATSSGTEQVYQAIQATVQECR